MLTGDKVSLFVVSFSPLISLAEVFVLAAKTNRNTDMGKVSNKFPAVFFILITSHAQNLRQSKIINNFGLTIGKIKELLR
jgi:hypothetical protein